ncbi:MAG: hypothetical protein WCD57_06355 [Acidobacteriaceae bacterium]
MKASPRLCEFLFYVSDCALRHAPEDATEQQIGIRVFHRPPGYNSSEDSIVRTHARLLRQKLAGYFEEEGHGEELVVEIPKGHYIPVFRPKHGVAPVPASPVPVLPQIVEPVKPEQVAVTPPAVVPRRLIRGRPAAALVLLFAIVFTAGAARVWRRWAAAIAPQSAVTTFWKPFFSDDPALLIYSNAMFVGDSKDGLRYARPEDLASEKNSDRYVDTYTGIGELASVYTLTRLFDDHRAHFILKRSMLTTWDEAKTKDLIFIGSTAENPSLRVSESVMDFTLTADKDSAGFVNHHPEAGEPAIYSRPEHPMTRDYAVLALLPGMQPGKRILIFSGLTTLGTQAAVDYVCRPDSAADLLRRLGWSGGEIRPFEALLETSVGGGVPLQTKLVTIRLH